MNITPFNPLDKDRLAEILQQIRQARIAVIGDFCLDVYWILDLSASELSVETNKMTRPVREQRYSLGGAGNVVANLSDLGVGTIHAFGVVGNDPFGGKLLALLQQKSDCRNVLVSESDDWQTMAYCKPYVGAEELSRIDMGNFNRLPEALANDLLTRLEHKLSDLDMVIINEQVLSGIHTPLLQSRLAQIVTKHQERVFVFDGRHVRNVYNDAWLKINSHEALALCGIARDLTDKVTRAEVLKAVASIFNRTGKPVIVTRGARGCIVGASSGIFQIPAIHVAGTIDTVGAGDSFLAGLTAALATGASLAESAQLGNLVSAVTIQKIGQTGTATPAEVLNLAGRAGFIDE